jgi:hypothetical protein
MRQSHPVERTPDGNALHDLDPIAGRVLGRQDCEGAARAGAKAGYPTVIMQSLAVTIRHQGGFLTYMQTGELGLLEISIDPHLAERGDGH